MCQHTKNLAPQIRVVSNKKKILIEDKLPYLVEKYQAGLPPWARRKTRRQSKHYLEISDHKYKNTYKGVPDYKAGVPTQIASAGDVQDAMPVSFRSILFTSYILTIFKQRNLLT